jgi:hypothetical protein
MNGKIFSGSVGYGSVATPTHSPVKKTILAVANQGELPAGMLYALDANSKVIPYNRTGAAPANVLKGVLDKSIDTSEDTAAVGIVHGTVNQELLVYGADSGAVTVADIAALEAIGIWAQ